MAAFWTWLSSVRQINYRGHKINLDEATSVEWAAKAAVLKAAGMVPEDLTVFCYLTGYIIF